MARTIAGLNGSDTVRPDHLSEEAINYCNPDREGWAGEPVDSCDISIKTR